MIALTICSLLLTFGIPVHNLPPVSEDSDVIVVMMRDGLLPEEPWEGMTTYQREEFWTLACSGMMVQRAAWAGYLIICPAGIGDVVIGTALALASAEGVPDTSALSSGLRLHPVSDSPSTVLHFSRGGADPPPSELPVRASTWLGEGPDTLIISSPEEGNAFFWSGDHDGPELSIAAWRGTGTELVPTSDGSLQLAFTCVHGGVPSNLASISVEPHPLDGYYMNTWGRAFSAVDNIIAQGHPVREGSGHLLWIRGDGTGRPWRTAPSPLPPPSAYYTVGMPLEPSGEHPLRELNASSVPNASVVRLPGRLIDPDRGPLLKAVLERIIGRDLHPGSGGNVHFDVEYDREGHVSIWLIGEDGHPVPDGLLAEVHEILRNSVLVPPGRSLVRNAAVRASYLVGEVLEPVGVRTVSVELMSLLYPEF